MKNGLPLGLEIKKLKIIEDSRGSVNHFLNEKSDSFERFGEAYFSKINHGVIKGWKTNLGLTQNMCVIKGEVLFVFYDDRKDSKTFGYFKEILLNDSHNYCLLTIPKNLWYSFKCLSQETAIVANIIDMPHNDSKSKSIALDDAMIPYNWVV